MPLNARYNLTTICGQVMRSTCYCKEGHSARMLAVITGVEARDPTRPGPARQVELQQLDGSSPPHSSTVIIYCLLRTVIVMTRIKK